MNILIGIYETRSFTFHVVAENHIDAKQALHDAWRRHCDQTGADPDYFVFEDVSWLGVEMASLTDAHVFRDYDLLYSNTEK